jgi:hypothetical protein
MHNPRKEMERTTKLLSAFILIMMVTSCQKQGFFREMPNRYHCDSSMTFCDFFRSLEIGQGCDGNSIIVKTPDCNLIPFCGILKYQGDSIFHSDGEGSTEQLFLALRDKKFSTRSIHFSPSGIVEVTHLGKIYDKILRDSITLFKLRPINNGAVPDTDYLKYVGINDGGIRVLTFSSGNGSDISFELREWIRVINK